MGRWQTWEGNSSYIHQVKRNCKIIYLYWGGGDIGRLAQRWYDVNRAMNLSTRNVKRTDTVAAVDSDIDLFINDVSQATIANLIALASDDPLTRGRLIEQIIRVERRLAGPRATNL
jgi:hypothetical protein